MKLKLIKEDLKNGKYNKATERSTNASTAKNNREVKKETHKSNEEQSINWIYNKKIKRNHDDWLLRRRESAIGRRRRSVRSETRYFLIMASLANAIGLLYYG